MMFVDRNPTGAITGLFMCAQYDGQEELPDENAEVVAFKRSFETQMEEGENARALTQRRIADLESSDDLFKQVEALRLRLSLVGG